MSYATCDHLKEDGVYCDSPALRGQNFCYFHLNVRARRMQAAQARRRGETCRIHLPVLEDMHAVQASLMQVLDALADDRIDHKRAGLMLYGLQLASTSLIGTPGWKGKREQVACAEPLRAIEAPDVAAAIRSAARRRPRPTARSRLGGCRAAARTARRAKGTSPLGARSRARSH